MLRERAVGESLWEAVLPAELRELPPEFAKVDSILDDDRFLAPFRSRLTATIGRPTIPIETYLRLMYLRHRYGLGYETLCKGGGLLYLAAFLQDRDRGAGARPEHADEADQAARARTC